MGRVATSQFQLNATLRDLNHFAIEHVLDLSDAYNADQFAQISALKEAAFERLTDGAAALAALPDVDEDTAFSQQAVKRLARLAAVAIHTHIAARSQSGRLAPLAEDPAYILRAIRRAETRYCALLLDARVAANTGRADWLAAILSACFETVAGDVAYAAAAIAGQADGPKSAGLAAVRTGHVARRLAMLAAASMMLMFRLTTASKAAGLRKVAENRTQLARPWREMLAAVPTVSGAAIGDRVRLQAQVSDVAWVDDGDGYTKAVVSAGDVTELRLPRRNAQRAGLANGSWVYLAGTVEKDAGTTFLEVGRVPITDNAAEIWEDYLIAETRPAYDMMPGSIDMLWEMPDLSQIGARNDLHGRL